MRRGLALAFAVVAGCAQLEQAPAPVQQEPPSAPASVPPPLPAPTPPPVAVLTPAPPAPAPPVEPEENRQAAELLGYTQRIASMGADDQRRELGAASQALTRDRSSYSRVKVGLLYALPGTAIQDDARALAMLEPLAGGTGALKQLAALVHAQVAERMKAQKRADQLKEQLDALRDVERSIIERGQQTQSKKP
jgi:hypothetical protein